MKKDIIYLDIEDDITTVIGKVKDSGEKIVALVPPKRVGVLQSLVNLKLLQRAADSTDKRIVLITNDDALRALAARVSLPVAKNLQSKPEVLSVKSDDSDGLDVINGEELSVGDLMKTVPNQPKAEKLENKKESLDNALSSIESEEFSSNIDNNTGETNKKTSKDKKIPDFNTFRKRLFIFGGLGVVLLIALFYIFNFVGEAKVIITTKTSIVNVDKNLKLLASADKPNPNNDSLPMMVKQVKKPISVEFTATGKKDIGEKATGEVILTNDGNTDSITVLAGTIFEASGGQRFTLDSAVTIAGTKIVDWQIKPGTARAKITAVDVGSEYNIGEQSLKTSASVKARLVSATSGGSNKVVTVVSTEDVEKAKEKLKNQNQSSLDSKKELTRQFGSDFLVIDSSFLIEPKDPVSTPEIDKEATNAKLTAETTYTMVGVNKKDLASLYESYVNQQIKNDKLQKIYDSGEKTTQFSQFNKNDSGYSVKVNAIATIGPSIDSKQLAISIAKKRTGEAQQMINAIQGVKGVEIELSPFWVNKIPEDASRIKIDFVRKDD